MEQEETEKTEEKVELPENWTAEVFVCLHELLFKPGGTETNYSCALMRRICSRMAL